MRAVVLLLATLAACRMGFDPIDTSGPVETDAAATSGDGAASGPDSAPIIPCDTRIPSTDNMYLPRAQCLAELDAARTECNADPACVLTGWYWYPMSTGINDTGACADGGGNTGCRQWRCSTWGAIPTEHVVI